jgi:hypothetical protein
VSAVGNVQVLGVYREAAERSKTKRHSSHCAVWELRNPCEPYGSRTP